MDREGIIQNIRTLPAYISNVYLNSDEQKYFFYESKYKVYYQQIKSLYDKWYPKAGNYKDETIVLFLIRNRIEEKDYKVLVKYSLLCLLSSSERVHRNINEFHKQNDWGSFKNEMNLLKEISFEASMLLEFAFNVMENEKVLFGQYKRKYVLPREVFSASTNILRHSFSNTSIGHSAISPTSVFLIRQSIELWLQFIFGIDVVFDENGTQVKLQPERLFDLIELKDGNVSLPIPKDLIQNIHKWTQLYVHAGYLPEVYIVEHIQFILRPIFYPENVKIKKAYYDNIEVELCKILQRESIKLDRMENHYITLV